LAVNATDAMPLGGSLTIETRNVTLGRNETVGYEDLPPGDYVMVCVTDTGTGMHADVLEKAAEPFFTTKEVGQGSGLGLSMVYGFAKQSGGHFAIYSEVGFGTTINLFFPRSGEAPAQISGESPQEGIRGSERILVVEDDPILRAIPERILRDQGYDVVGAENGREAVTHLKESGNFDLLFTDIVLPGNMSGIEIAEEARRLQPNIKVVYTTGYADTGKNRSKGSNSEDVLVNKPYRRTKLLSTVRSMFDGV